VSPQPLRVLVVDDEPLARRRLLRLLAKEPDPFVATECGSGREAAAAILAGGIDAVFLDVQMPGLDGFDVLEAVGPGAMPAVVFVTAYDQYAVRAFEVNAVDYLLKPYDRERFRRAAERLRAVIRLSRAEVTEPLGRLLAELARRDRRPERFLVASGGGIAIVPAADVDWIEAQGNYVALHAGTATHLLREGIGALAGRLDPEVFVRVRRTAIVNLLRVSELKPWAKDEHVVVLSSGARVAVSRGFLPGMERRLARGRV
jgi:two-component system LytT family response regulator